jgi:hypothetical protein
MRTAAFASVLFVLSSIALGCGSGGDGDSFSAVTDGGYDPSLDGGFSSNDDAGPFTGELGDAVCASTVLEGRRAEVAMLFLVDRSGSMNCAPTTDAATCDARPVRPASGASKFDLVRTSLTQAVAGLRDADRAGLAVFGSDDACGVSTNPLVPVASLSAAQRQSLTTAISGITPKGATPLVGGTTVAYEHLNPNRPGYDLPKRRFLVVVSDGAETCAPSAVSGFLASTVDQARSVGIKTFVVGAPGSESARNVLSEMAFRGGTAKSSTCTHGGATTTSGDCHVDLTQSGASFGTALSSALLTASRLAIPCEVELPANIDANVVDFSRAVVRVTSSTGAVVRVPEDRTAACEFGANGWQYEDGNARVVLCGTACEALRSDRGSKVTVELGCRGGAGPSTR